MATTTATPAGTNPLSILGDALEAAAESIGDARSDATESAKAAARKVKSGISAGAYQAAYGLSFGIVFGGVFLKELLPENSAVRRGFEEGAEAAFDTFAARKARQSAFTEAEGHEDVEPPAEAPKPAKPRARKTVRVVKKAAG